MACHVTSESSRALVPAFANPHRVLKKDGVIPEDWRDDDGNGREECRRRLEEDEQIQFTDDGRASDDYFIGWEKLKELLDADEASNLGQ